jgi:hypothetical protein
MTFQYDAAAALARIKAGLSQHRVEHQKPERSPAKLANPAKAGSAAQGGLAGLAGLAGVPVDFHTGDHATQAVSSPIEDQKSARTPAKVAKPANPFSAPVPADAAPALARRAQFKERGADIALRRLQGHEWSAEDWLAYFDERAAIAEFDGGLSRPEAEARAFQSCTAEWLGQHPVSSKADDGCVICGDGDRANDGLLPTGLGGGLERVWLHRDCIPVWHSARMAEAVAALRAMNISAASDASHPSALELTEGTGGED